MRARFVAGAAVVLGLGALTWALTAHRPLFEPEVALIFEILNRRQTYEPEDYGFAVAITGVTTFTSFAALAWSLLAAPGENRRIDRLLARKEMMRERRTARPPRVAVPRSHRGRTGRIARQALASRSTLSSRGQWRSWAARSRKAFASLAAARGTQASSSMGSRPALSSSNSAAAL